MKTEQQTDLGFLIGEILQHQTVLSNSKIKSVTNSILQSIESATKPVKEFPEGGEWEVWSHTSELADTGDYMSSCGIKNGKYTLYLGDEDEDEILPVLSEILNKR